ncbi:exodeoxyribonuclease V subunit beta [Thiocystis violacea]|uniref:exodeoxyribonuclease V subunit beta n=1 Tax=Thiocystis violacea TaxID=13725 RepID=UPI0019077292|nr:exodeoxyribonuclease V subunit beta [Thiocystis violacea]MBK1723093.1 exodeoxyribonuclease V subunit beta [Thiocystis violacea]
MTTPIQRLEPLRFPLQGSRLIEASAGTGKTFTLAMLYLRLILQHGEGHAFHHALLPPEILVVTFTNAATDELRDRIRRRLVEAAAVFRGQVADADADPLLLQLRDELGAEATTRGARQLECAAEWMDEAAISTIHAWCYRMLREHAFDSGNAFDQQLENSDGDLLQQATEDYWRSFYLNMGRDDLALVRGYWKTPVDLVEALRRLLPYADRLPQADPPETGIRDCRAAKDSRVQALKTQWSQQAHADALEQLFDQAAAAKAFKQSSLNRGHRAGVLQGLRQWMASPEQVAPDFFDKSGKSWRRMSSLDIAEIWIDPATAPAEHPACRALTKLHAQLDDLPEPYAELLTHAVHWVKSRLETEKRRQALLTQNDLLIRLDQALCSERGERLADSIRRQFPVALVDEFQDTDPLQYRIFDSIYRVRDADPQTGFFMIGDPKQAIYGFRGADIYTYLIARADTEQRHYTLDTNYRSSKALITAVNALFQLGEQGAGRGAFLFRQGDDNPVPFFAVQPRKDAQGTLLLDGQPCAPLQVWLVEDDIGKGHYGELMAEVAAREIARLLRQGQEDRARLPDGEGGERRLRPSDLAVLVNNRGEADRVRGQLARLGVASVYLSERSNVFATAVAGELVILLRAIANPLNEWLLRQALATRLLGLTLAELDRLNCDELYWEEQGELFRTYQALWRRQGALPLLYRLLADFQVAARLLRAPGGERELTDLLHLGELLQSASEQLDGELALLRYLEESRAAADEEAPEAQQLRLESDEHLVRVVTIHKSKGLEYPLVFLPFIANSRAAKAGDLPLKTHDADKRLQIHLGGDDAILAQADEERLGEDLRKLYVALTRARYANWLGLAPAPNFAGSALAYLLNSDGSDLGARVRGLSCLSVIDLPQVDPDPYEADVPQVLATARAAPELHRAPWWITSYSALTRETLPSRSLDAEGLAPADVPSADTAVQETTFEETAASPPATGAVQLYPDKHLHALPRGSRYGTFLHGILEWAATPVATDAAGRRLRGFAAAVQARALRREMLGQRCNLRRLTEWIDPLDAWLEDFLTREWILHGLAGDGGSATRLALRDLPPERVQVEMEFWLESRAVDLGALDRLVQQHVLVGQPRPLLGGHHINGMLKGFIDLVFEHDGRFYVVDWKSNWLGPEDAAYSQEAMRAAMLHARYELQYVLYLLALHRQLKARLPDYDYDRHIGGAVYVFLRGGYAESQGLFMDKPPRILIEALDRMFAGASRGAEEGAR